MLVCLVGRGVRAKAFSKAFLKIGNVTNRQYSVLEIAVEYGPLARVLVREKLRPGVFVWRYFLLFEF